MSIIPLIFEPEEVEDDPVLALEEQKRLVADLRADLTDALESLSYGEISNEDLRPHVQALRIATVAQQRMQDVIDANA